jgi:Peptidase A4 family
MGRKSRAVAVCLAVMAVLATVVPGRAAAGAPPASSPAAGPAGPHARINCGHGTWLLRPRPLAHFNPLTASAARLRAADFPQRPADPAMRATWRSYVRKSLAGKVIQASECPGRPVAAHRHPPRLTPHPGGAPGPAATGDSSATWAGNVAHDASYTDAEASWIVPPASGGSGRSSSHWVGIGLGSSSTYPIAQAGSESPGSNAGSIGWIEVWPQEGQVHLGMLSNIEYDLLFVHVRFTAGVASFHVVDEDLGLDYYVVNDNYPGIRPDGHAEFIAERPSDSHNNPYCLANFGTMEFLSAQAAAGGTWRPIGALAHYYLWMQNGSHRLASPGPIDSSGRDFTVTWQNYC